MVTAIKVAIALCAIATLVGVANGYVYTFQDSDMSDWTAGGSGSVSFSNYYTDTKNVRLYNAHSFWSDTYIKHDVSYPTNYWAFTSVVSGNDDIGDQGSIGISLYNISGYKIGDYMSISPVYWTTTHRIEYKRESSNLSVYVDGAMYANYGIITTVPYYVAIRLYSDYHNLPWVKVDDIVIGTNEEHNVIGCPPQTWFVAKDVFDPGFSGLYDVPNHQAYANAMHISYATDDGSGTVVVTHSSTGEVVNTTTVSTYAGIITYNLTSMLFTSGAPYGEYVVSMSGSTAYDTFWYTGIATTGTSIAWDNTTYSDGDTATINYTISASHWVPADYTYEMKIEAADFSDRATYSISSRPTGNTETVSISATTFPATGTYYCTLYAVDRSSSEEILLAYDDAVVTISSTGEITVSGTTFDATTATALPSCTVTSRQLGVDSTTTSNAVDGTYTTTTLVTGASIGMNASKTDYKGFAVYFTPVDPDGTYVVDIGLVPWVEGAADHGTYYYVSGGNMSYPTYSNVTTPYWNLSEDGTALGGLISEGPFLSASSGATVLINNSSWSDTYTTDVGGWYQFNHLLGDSDYTITASKPGWHTVTGTVTVVADNFNRVDINLDEAYTLTVYFRDSVYNNFVTDTSCSAILSNGTIVNSNTGSAVFNQMYYGTYIVEGYASGYSGDSETLFMDSDQDVTLHMTPIDDGGGSSGDGGIQYSLPPRVVRFHCVDGWGNGCNQVNVTCQGYETTLPDWGILGIIFGWSGVYNETLINGTMSGYTGHDGTVDFMMSESLKYRMTFTNESQGISETLELYPKDDMYVITLGTRPMEISVTPVNITLWSVNTNASYVTLMGIYDDPNVHTTSVNFTVRSANGTVIYSHLDSGLSSVADSYPVSHVTGVEYVWGYAAVQSDYGTLHRYTAITLHSRLIDLGIEEVYYQWISIIFLFIFIALFSGSNVIYGYVLYPIMAGVFYYIGWLNISYLLVSAMIVLGVLLYMSKKKARGEGT